MILNVKYFKSINFFLNDTKDFNKKYLFFVAQKTKINLDELNSTGMDFAGAIFSEIIYNEELYDEGLIVIELNQDLELLFIKDIKTAEFNDNEFSGTKSIISIVEGVSKYNEDFLDKLFASVNLNTRIVGGGAGFIKNNSGVIFDNEGFYFDSAILVKIKKEIELGVKHGCKYLSGPYVATSCTYNLLNEIDYTDAFELYKKVIREDSSIIITAENFSDIAKNYPIGIVKYNSEQIVRDPISLENGKLFLAGEIKNNSVINILKVDKTSMLESSKEAAKDSIKEDSNLVFMFDCLSRVNYLQDNFSEELNNITCLTTNKTLLGAVTIGEIANSGNKYINYYNKTCVIGSL